jgi:hypothetical protein
LAQEDIELSRPLVDLGGRSQTDFGVSDKWQSRSGNNQLPTQWNVHEAAGPGEDLEGTRGKQVLVCGPQQDLALEGEWNSGFNASLSDIAIRSVDWCSSNICRSANTVPSRSRSCTDVSGRSIP